MGCLEQRTGHKWAGLWVLRTGKAEHTRYGRSPCKNTVCAGISMVQFDLPKKKKKKKRREQCNDGVDVESYNHSG